MKIRTKILITFFVIAFILAISLMGIVYSSMVTHFEHQEGERLKDNVKLSAIAIDDFMFAREQDFNILSNNPLFSISSHEDISDYLTGVIEQYPYYEHISFVDKDAIILASTSKEFRGLNIITIEPDIEKEFYNTLKGGDEDVYISDIAEVSQKEIDENSPLDIELLSNVIDLKGNVIGVLVGFVNVQFIKDIIYDIDKRTIGDEFAYLVNDTGDIVITANPEIKILQPHPDLFIKDLQQKLKNEEDGYMVYKNSKGIKVISGHADLSEYGTDNIGNWSLISTAPYNIIMKPIYQMFYNVLFAFIIILTGIFLLTIKFSRTLSKPIIQLEKAVAKFDMNSKPIELKISKNDEVGKLGKSFNVMSQKIYKSSEERKHIEKLLKESKDQLDKIINNIGDPVFVKDDQSRLLIVNDAFCKIFNLTKSDILGLTLAENVTEIERESFLKIDKQVLEDGIENINEESLTISDQKTRIITTKKTRYVDENGTKFLIGVIHDITERKKTEEALFKTNERNELISRATNDTLWDLKLDTNIVWWNQGITELFGYTLENNETTPDWWVQNIHPEERERVEAFFFNVVNSDANFWDDEYRFKCHDGSYKFVYDRGIVRRDEQGKAYRMLGAMMDITQRKLVEIELEKYKNNLEELVETRTSELEKEKIKAQSADLMKSAFLATMSHELRTPMNSIIGFTGILLKEFAGPLNEEQKKQLHLVKNSGQHLLGLINDVLDISKIEAGKLNVSNTPFSYKSTLEKTIDFIRPQANIKGLKIRTEYSETEIIINSDERRVEQVTLNLISNAIKFSNKGIILVKVDVNNNFITTQIIDQGIGISKVDQNKLFMPFIQLKSGLTRRHEGTGLGLAICKSLIEKLGGTIKVQSKKGEGSNFTFTLPIEQAGNK